MDANEHYAKAESLLRTADTAASGPNVSNLLAEAQTHALLACAARLTDLVSAAGANRMPPTRGIRSR